ncbi:MAG: hypothetical protein AB7V56_12600 [Candidatus Nitrosocosmicus sp.]
MIVRKDLSEIRITYKGKKNIGESCYPTEISDLPIIEKCCAICGQKGGLQPITVEYILDEQRSIKVERKITFHDHSGRKLKRYLCDQCGLIHEFGELED